MNTTVSETTTVEATKRPGRRTMRDGEIPVSSTVSETTTIEATTRAFDPIDPAADALQEFVLARILRMATAQRNPVRFDTRCSCSRNFGGTTRIARRPSRRRNG